MKFSLFVLKILAPSYAQFHIKEITEWHVNQVPTYSDSSISPIRCQMKFPIQTWFRLITEVVGINVTLFSSLIYSCVPYYSILSGVFVDVVFVCVCVFFIFPMLYRLSLVCYIEHIFIKRKFPCFKH